MKSVLISIQPKWCELIASGKKTIEVRKTRPKIETPFKCYIYCTKQNNDRIPSRNFWKMDKSGFNWLANGKVIGEFVCNEVDFFDSEISEWAYSVAPPGSIMPMHEFKAYNFCTEEGCLSADYVITYFGDAEWKAYFWHISNLVIYDKPKELDTFCSGTAKGFFSKKGSGMKRPPQSYCYVESLED